MINRWLKQLRWFDIYKWFTFCRRSSCKTVLRVIGKDEKIFIKLNIVFLWKVLSHWVNWYESCIAKSPLLSFAKLVAFIESSQSFSEQKAQKDKLLRDFHFFFHSKTYNEWLFKLDLTHRKILLADKFIFSKWNYYVKWFFFCCSWHPFCEFVQRNNKVNCRKKKKGHLSVWQWTWYSFFFIAVVVIVILESPRSVSVLAG